MDFLEGHALGEPTWVVWARRQRDAAAVERDDVARQGHGDLLRAIWRDGDRGGRSSASVDNFERSPIETPPARGSLEAFSRLDRESIYRRFFSPKKELSDAELKQLTDVDFARVVALVITVQTPDGEVLIAGGRYAAEPSDRPQSAELAFLTGETHRGRGVASLLLRHLVELAKDSGLSRFEAEVLAENQPMLNVFRRSGSPMTQRREGSVVHITLSLE